MSRPFLFADFEPGTVIGVARERIDTALIAQWEAIYGPVRDVPPALLQPIMMRAYMAVMPIRPPGNVHAGQRFSLLALPRLDDEVVTEIHCIDKGERRGACAFRSARGASRTVPRCSKASSR
ncbi:MAG: hypothetical protein WDN44_13280 [Sphingomonas sp.]